MTPGELQKLDAALFFIKCGRVNDGREELEELRAAAVENRTKLLSLRHPEPPAQAPVFATVERPA